MDSGRVQLTADTLRSSNDLKIADATGRLLQRTFFNPLTARVAIQNRCRAIRSHLDNVSHRYATILCIACVQLKICKNRIKESSLRDVDLKTHSHTDRNQVSMASDGVLTLIINYGYQWRLRPFASRACILRVISRKQKLQAYYGSIVHGTGVYLESDDSHNLMYSCRRLSHLRSSFRDFRCIIKITGGGQCSL